MSFSATPCLCGGNSLAIVKRLVKMKKMNVLTPSECRDVWVFAEIQDHERVSECALEILTRGRELADRLGEKLYAVVPALDAEQYLDTVKKYGPDRIICCSHPRLKHYHGMLFPALYTELIRRYKPSIMLFPSSEAGKDLAPRLALRFSTGLTTHCSGLDLLESAENGPILRMKRPAFSGNMVATIVCPSARPQMATVQPGVFTKREAPSPRTCEVIPFEFDYEGLSIREKSLAAPLRWDKPQVSLEKAPVIAAGGRGMGSREDFEKLHELADLLGGEVGATRVPVFNRWCGEERMIGQTGKTVKPRLYLGFGVSGQIQHTASIVGSDIIVSVNRDPEAPLNDIADYVIHEDAPCFLNSLVERLNKLRKI